MGANVRSGGNLASGERLVRVHFDGEESGGRERSSIQVPSRGEEQEEEDGTTGK